MSVSLSLGWLGLAAVAGTTRRPERVGRRRLAGPALMTPRQAGRRPPAPTPETAGARVLRYPGAVGGRAVLAAVVCLAFSPGASAASASDALGDVNISNVSLAVNGKAEALLTYTHAGRKAPACARVGAVNALPRARQPPQVRFQIGLPRRSRKVQGIPGYREHFGNACRPCDGPPLDGWSRRATRQTGAGLGDPVVAASATDAWVRALEAPTGGVQLRPIPLGGLTGNTRRDPESAGPMAANGRDSTGS